MARIGLDWHPYATTTDAAERLLEVAVAMRAADMRQEEQDAERRNLAVEVGNHVGTVVGRAMAEIARAMR